jgi:RNA polymerase sigma factor (sigma-70 family)
MPTTWTSDEVLFRLALTDLAATAPVSPLQEKQLIKTMLKGKAAAQQLTNERSLNSQQRTALVAKKTAGAAARRMLIQANGRLVIHLAGQYYGRGLSLVELAQEGMLGLIRAIDKFDPDKGTRLSTYATYWIRQNISRALAVQTRTIRLPVYKVDRLIKIRRTATRLTQQLGRTPDIEEIATALDDTPDRVRELLRDGQEMLNLDEPLGADELTLADLVEDDSQPSLEDQVASKFLSDEIERTLSKLSPRECRIIELRYGLRDGHPLTLQDIADQFGLTRERIRQIEREALTKLRQPTLADRLIDFVN